MKFPPSASFDPEITAGASPTFKVVGVDEVGRGPLAGPVVAAAVHIPLDLWGAPEVARLQDSKKLSAKARPEVAAWIKAHCAWRIAEASVAEIDRFNILHASLLAMTRALEPLAPNLALIDGNRAPQTDVPCQTLVKGDAKSRSIAAASILAKDHRDRLMVALDARFPGYGWAQNAGYPTAVHRAALQHLGPTCHHRATFRGVKNVTDAP